MKKAIGHHTVCGEVVFSVTATDVGFRYCEGCKRANLGGFQIDTQEEIESHDKLKEWAKGRKR